MREKYNNLILALAQFAEDMWIPYQDSIGSLNVSIKGGMINRENLIKEFEEANSDSKFDWKQLAKESELFISVDPHSNEELKEHIQNLLTLFLHPELHLTIEQQPLLEETIVSILKKRFQESKDGLSSADLITRINSIPGFSNIRSYHIWDLFLKKILYDKLPITRKPLKHKERYIGYLIYKDV